MDLRPRERVVNVFTGFSRAETEKMESLLNEKGDLVLSKEFCQKLAWGFTRSSGRAGKPAVKCIEVQSWFQIKKEEYLLRITSSPHASDTFSGHDRSEMPKGEKTTRFSELEFEAKSAKDGAWYDVSVFLSHRILPSGDAEAHVRYVGFGAEEDEWVNIRDAVRVRSVPLEPDECRKVNVGDVILCFQERRDQAIYFDARVLEIERRLHDVRGCRCLFLIQYNHDNSEEKVGLRRLCYRPTYFSEQW